MSIRAPFPLPARALGLLALAGCSPMPKIHFNEPPSAPTVEISPAVPVTTDALEASVVTDSVDPEGDDMEYVFAWSLDGVPYGSNVRVIDPSATAKDQVWSVDVSATDGEWDGASASAEVTIVNAPPSIDTLTISPAAPRTTDDLVLDPRGTDPDGDIVTWVVEWSRAGTVEPGYTGLTVPASATNPQEAWSATVTPYDGAVYGAPQSVDVYIDNTTPTATGVTLTPSAPEVGDAIRASIQNLVDPDEGQTVSTTFTWSVNGFVVSSETTTTGYAYLSGAFAKGDSVTVTAVPDDGYALGSLVMSSPVTVINTPPVLDSVELTPTSGYESTTFDCLAGSASDEDGDRVTYQYDWYVNGTAISASTETLTGTDFRKDDEIYCVVTPYDGDDTGTPVLSDTATIANTVPVIGSVTLSPTSPTVASSITATIVGATDADGDAISYTYSWSVNGTHVGASSSQLASSLFVRGDSVKVSVTPSDGTVGTAVSSSAVTVANALPSLSSASITPSNPYTDDDLTVQVSGFSDADGDSASYTYQWYKNGVAVTGQTSRTLSSSLTTRSDRFYCSVTPNDGIEDGTARASSTVQILNTAPDIVADATSGLTATECDTIDLDASGSSDADGDTLSYTWSLSSKPSASLASTTDLDTSTSEQPTFLVDGAGTFVFGLSGSDGSTSSTDTVSIEVYDRTDNIAPVAVAGDDDSDVGYGACSYNGSSYNCSPCTGTTFTLDGGSSYDDDGDPLHYIWTTSSGHSTIASSTSESTTLRMSNLPATHGVTTTYTASVTLRVVDCAGDVSEDYVTLTFECTGT